MTKRIISVLLAGAMIFAICAIGSPVSAVIDTEMVYGDINGDNVVSTDDAGIALRVAAGLETISDVEAFNRGDINSDGYITLYDARQILRSCADLANLQPTGAFGGFEGYEGNGITITTEDQAIAVFNTFLNKIKTDKPGFMRSEGVEVKLFDFDGCSFVGYNFSEETAESVSATIREKLVTESDPEMAQTVLKGQNCDNAMSAETETYVSKLSAKDVYGIKASVDATETGTFITISVALADCEIANVSQTAYDDVFNPAILQENSESVVENIFGSNTYEDARTKELRNAVLTVVVDAETATVVSYTTTYQTYIRLNNASFGVSNILSAELTNLEYITEVTVVYDHFSW